MRFVWLAVSIMTPLVAVHFIDAEAGNEMIQGTYAVVATSFFIVAISFTISDFVKHRNGERHEEHRRLLLERDADIVNWRKEFFLESADLYDAQKTMLLKAKELGEQHESYRRSSSTANADAGRSGDAAAA